MITNKKITIGIAIIGVFVAGGILGAFLSLSFSKIQENHVPNILGGEEEYEQGKRRLAQLLEVGQITQEDINFCKGMGGAMVTNKIIEETNTYRNTKQIQWNGMNCDSVHKVNYLEDCSMYNALVTDVSYNVTYNNGKEFLVENIATLNGMSAFSLEDSIESTYAKYTKVFGTEKVGVRTINYTQVGKVCDRE